MSVANNARAIAEILQGCVDGKTAIADALTSKGVPTEPEDSFDTMAVNVGLIEGGGNSDLDNFMVWYSDDKVNWIPMTKHPNWDKVIANTKAHQMVDRTIVNVNGTVPTVSAVNHWYMPIYKCLSTFNQSTIVGSYPGNYDLFGDFGNALIGGNKVWYSDNAPTKVATLTSSVSTDGDIIYTKTIKLQATEINFPVVNKYGVCLPAASGAGSCLLLGYCDIPPFQLSTTAKTFYIKITF